MLLNVMHFPKADVPFVFVDVRGTLTQCVTHFHHNTTEASVCMVSVSNLMQRGIAKAIIAVIRSYKEKYR